MLKNLCWFRTQPGLSAVESLSNSHGAAVITRERRRSIVSRFENDMNRGARLCISRHTEGCAERLVSELDVAGVGACRFILPPENLYGIVTGVGNLFFPTKRAPGLRRDLLRPFDPDLRLMVRVLEFRGYRAFQSRRKIVLRRRKKSGIGCHIRCRDRR
jgi:hypothetical protein